MNHPTSHPICSQDAAVYLEMADDKFQALQRAMDASGFLDDVEAAFQESEKAREAFTIAVKPNLIAASLRLNPNPVYTDPEPVEYLFERLRERGFADLAIVESRNVYALNWVQGEKMGVDPSDNYVIQAAIGCRGAITITRHGDMAPWPPWTNIRPATVKMMDAAEEVYGFSRLMSRSFANEQDERFPPVSRWQWLFGPIQSLSRLFERLFITKT